MKIPIIAVALMIVGPQATYAADVPGNKTTKVVLKTGGTGVSGVSETASDSDWYKVTLVGGQSYALTVSSDGCTTINLRDTSGKVLRTAQACNSGKGGYDGGFEYLTAKTTAYFVELVDKKSKTYPSRYNAIVIADAAGSNKTKAASLVSGQTVAGNLNWNKDIDFFPVALSAGSKNSLSLSNFYNMKNISLRIADASGKFVAGFDKLTSTKYQDFVVAKTGAYYAVVTGIGNSVGGRYNLSFGATGGSDGAGVPEGSYRAADGTICTVDNVKIQGRTQSYLGCDRPSGTYHFELSVVSGSVSSGHPYLPQLVNYGVDRFSGVASYIWGIETNNSFYIGGCGYFSSGTPVGAQVNGKFLTLSPFYASRIYCSASLTKQ